MPTVADLLVRRLLESGVRTLVGLPGGGSNLDLLFITTARHGLNADSLRTQTHAGAILVIETKTCGIAPYAFGG